MADSNISIVGLRADAGVSQIVLQWAVDDPNFDGLSSLKYSIAEVWMSLSSNMAGAVKLGEAFTAFADQPIPRGQQRFYQVRAKNRAGQHGAFTATVNATEISGNVLISVPGYWVLPSGLILQWGIYSVPSGGYGQVTFPTPFPRRCFLAVASLSTSLPSFQFLGTIAETRFVFDAYLQDGNGNPIGGTFKWLAMGN